jgi:hypothetical protein
VLEVDMTVDTLTMNKLAISNCISLTTYMMHRAHFLIPIMTILCRRLSGFVNPRITIRHSSPSNLYSNNHNKDPLIDATSGLVGGLLSSAISRAQSTLEQTSESSETARNNPREKRKQLQGKYHGNPTIANTALAHSLWQTVLRPNMDSAIDATCGNGHDSCVIARILFDEEAYEESSQSHLLSIDIQSQACGNTTDALKQELGEDIFEKHVQVLQTSHSPLPYPSRNSVVGLVVYNLGWLPNSDKDCITKVDSTLESIADGILLVRIGGMMSVVTYPKTNPEEDIAVRVFLECVALLSSNVQTWRDFLDADDNAELASLSQEIRQKIIAVMEHIVEMGDFKQTWRVSEHRKLGMHQSPILLTATRIK